MLRDRLHAHVCPDCGHRWEHHPDDMIGHAAFVAGHTCPECGCDSMLCRDPIPPLSNPNDREDDGYESPAFKRWIAAQMDASLLRERIRDWYDEA